MNQDRDNDHFDKMTDFLTQEARRHVLDAIACEFHNQGYTLNGNTEASDVAWLARRIGDRIDYLALSNDDLLKVAEVARHAMSELADRMASRLHRSLSSSSYDRKD